MDKHVEIEAPEKANTSDALPHTAWLNKRTRSSNSIVYPIDEPEIPHSCLKPSNHNLLDQYQQIGQLLLICEASLYSIGIAWLPPSVEVRARIAQYNGPLEEFTRLSLVTVSTQALECYVSDLSSSVLEDAESLYIPMPGTFHRNCLAILLFFSFFAANILLCNLLGYAFLDALIPSISLAVVGGIFGYLSANEDFRRRSFVVMLSKELDRRRGANIKPTSIVAKIETETVSD